MTGAKRTELSAFAGPGEMRERFRRTDWASTSLGPVASWPSLLRVMIAICLDSSFPMVVSWGRDSVLLYNDAYVPLLGSDLKDRAVGRAAKDVWPDTWSVSSPLITDVMERGISVRRDDMQFVLERNGYPEECYFTFSHSPLRDADDRVVGVFTVAEETTAYILHQRRLRIAQELGALSVTKGATPVETCTAAASVLRGTRESVPFVAVYLRDAPGDDDTARNDTAGNDTAGNDTAGVDTVATRISQVAAYGLTGIAVPGLTVPDTDGNWTVRAVIDSGLAQVIGELRTRSAPSMLPGPLGPLLPDQAVAMPLILAGATCPIGVLLVGVNPYRPLDTVYREFFSLVGRQFSVALADSYAYHLQRSKAEMLAVLDRAKTEFFQNVSHELRTPMTLILAPLTDVLAGNPRRLEANDRERLQTALRAAERLARMVDALLDLSRQPVGSVGTALQATDIGGLTADVASMFRSTSEHAGLTFQVEAPAEPIVADVDRSMWSTIVSNLISNAVKYTLSGGIAVRVRRAPTGAAELTVSDTGVGIPAEQQSLIFERFHRATSNDIPGAGIGLALVASLVTAHNGRISLASTPGQGSAFTVTVPMTATATAARKTPTATPVGNAGVTAAAPPAAEPARGAGNVAAHRPRLLLVEDDADLREYLAQVLRSDGWDVDAVGDVEAAVEAALNREPGSSPEIVISDIMLPGRSGLDLLRTLRTAEGSGRVPVILLTARAGPDAAVEGLQLGADDYITKPFSSEELRARVRAHHQLNHLREDAVGQARGRADQLRAALDSNRVIGTAMGMLIGAHRLNSANAFQLLVRCSQRTNRKLRDVAADVVSTGSLPSSQAITAEMLRAVRSAADDSGTAYSFHQGAATR